MSGVWQHRIARGGLAMVLAATLLLSGCIWTGWPLKQKPLQPPSGRPDPQRATAVAGPGWKVVSGKREPNILIARDGTECTVQQQAWEDAAVGEKTFCFWRIPGDRS